jgi:hypothetical protein
VGIRTVEHAQQARPTAIAGLVKRRTRSVDGRFMSSIAVPAPGRPTAARMRVVLLVVVSAVSAGLFVALHAGLNPPLPTFQGACERLRASGLEITARDWFCQPAPWTARAGFLAGSLLAAAGFALPCAILAVAGRRSWAFAPVIGLAFTAHPDLLYANEPAWWQGTWPVGMFTGAAVTMLLVVLPAGAIVFLRRAPVAPWPRISLVAAAAATMACGLASLPLRSLTDEMFERHFEAIGWTVGSVSLLWPAVAMSVFAAILGPDRRWWPWSLAPAAFLLSLGPSLALMVGGEGLRNWSMFGAVLPIFLVGLLWSAWRPLAVQLTRVIAREAPTRDPTPIREMEPIRPDRIRPTVVLHAVAVGMLTISMIAFHEDPLPAQIGTALPTYLGQRVVVSDLRLKLNLRLAIDAMDLYRAEFGSYRGFDAETGASIEPRLAWTERRTEAETPLWMWITPAADDVARVAGVSSSGNGFCLQRTADALTYGEASGGYGSFEGGQAMRAAVASCDQTPWSASAVQTPPIATMCDGIDPSGGYVICRMVQVLNVTTLRQTKPDGVLG